MELVDEEQVAFLSAGKQGRNVAGSFGRRTGRRVQIRAHRGGDDVCESGFAEAWWSSQQHVIERFATVSRRLHVDAQVFFDLPLPDVLLDTRRTQRHI